MTYQNITWSSIIDTIVEIYRNTFVVISDLWSFLFQPLSNLVGEDFSQTLFEIIDFLQEWVPFLDDYMLEFYRDLLTLPIIGVLIGSLLVPFLVVTIIKWIIGIVT